MQHIPFNNVMGLIFSLKPYDILMWCHFFLFSLYCAFTNVYIMFISKAMSPIFNCMLVMLRNILDSLFLLLCQGFFFVLFCFVFKFLRKVCFFSIRQLKLNLHCFKNVSFSLEKKTSECDMRES